MRSVLYDGGGFVERYGRKLLMMEVRVDLRHAPSHLDLDCDQHPCWLRPPLSCAQLHALNLGRPPGGAGAGSAGRWRGKPAAGGHPGGPGAAAGSHAVHCGGEVPRQVSATLTPLSQASLHHVALQCHHALQP